MPIVIACAVYTTTDNKEVLVIVNEAVLNADSPSTLMSKYQTQEAGNMVDSVSKCHFHWDGTPGYQAMKLVCVADTKDPEVVIDFSIQSALSAMTHRLPMEDDLHTLPHYFTTPAGVWVPRSQIDLGETPIPPLHSSDTIIAQQAMCQQLDDAIHFAFSSMPNPTREGGAFASPSPPSTLSSQHLMALLDTVKWMKPTGICLHVCPSFIDLDSPKVKRVPYTGPSIDKDKEDPKQSITRGTHSMVPVNGGNAIPTVINLSKGQQEPMFLDSYMELDQMSTGNGEESFLDTFTGLEGTDTQGGQDKDRYFYFDMIQSMPAKEHIGKAFHLTIDYAYVNKHMVPREDIINDMLGELSMDDLLRMNEYFDTYAFAVQTSVTIQDASKIKPYLRWHPLEIVHQTIEATLQFCMPTNHGNL